MNQQRIEALKAERRALAQRLSRAENEISRLRGAVQDRDAVLLLLRIRLGEYHNMTDAEIDQYLREKLHGR
jgi:hypothetical protein